MERLDILACPKCAGNLAVVGIGDSFLMCKGCGEVYPIKGGIPRFVPSDSYVESFSWEWNKHAKTLVDSMTKTSLSHDMFTERTGLKTQDVVGKLILDAGCGTGRFLEVVNEMGGHGVGIDLSYSVNEAQELLKDKSYIVQGDLMHLPFKPNSFDIVFSIGVLHHTPNARQAFSNLAKLVKPGGVLSVWVYSNDGWKLKVYNAMSSLYRQVTTRLPSKVLYRLCYGAIPLRYLHELTGRATTVFIPSSVNANRSICVLETFDWYSPKYQSKHTAKEVDAWCLDNGFIPERLSFPASVKAVKV